MNFPAFIALFTLLCTSTFASAQTGFALNISKHNSVTKGLEFKKHAASRQVITKELASIQIQLYERGYIEARIDTNWKGDTLNLDIMHGMAYTWAELRTDSITKTLFGESSEELRKMHFSKTSLYRLYQEIISHYENTGYPFARVGLKDVQIDTTAGISASLNVNKGPLILFDSLVVHGTAKIRHSFLRHYLGIHSGGIYNEALIGEMESKLQELRFAQVIRTHSINFTKASARIHIYLNERPVNQFNGLIAFGSSEEQPSRLQLSGDFRLKLLNTFEHGSELQLNWNKPPGNSQQLDMFGSYPYLLNTPFGVDYTLALDRQDSSYLNIEHKPGLRLYFSALKSIGVHLQVFRSQLIQTNTFNPDHLDVKKSNLGFSLQWTAYDQVIYPRKGYAIHARFEAGKKEIIHNTAFDEELYDSLKLNSFNAGIGIDLYAHLQLIKRHGAFLAIRGQAYQNENIQQNELFKIGGFDLLRGFDQDYFRSSAYGVSTLEYRFFLDRSSYLFLFWDLGILGKEPGKPEVDTPMGFGTGMNFGTPAGIFSISFALGKEQQRPVQFRNSKVHFGYYVRF